MTFIPAARVSDFTKPGRRTIKILGKRLLLTLAEDLSWDCIEIQCKHQGADLSEAKIIQNRVTCPRHGWIYDLTTGQCLNHVSAPLRRHEVLVEGDVIKVSAKPLEPDED
jgi:phenylpropionate dioxygenase-like ring-hydroxylating dioxygenase large terminal subunit